MRTQGLTDSDFSRLFAVDNVTTEAYTIAILRNKGKGHDQHD